MILFNLKFNILTKSLILLMLLILRFYLLSDQFNLSIQMLFIFSAFSNSYISAIIHLINTFFTNYNVHVHHPSNY